MAWVCIRFKDHFALTIKKIIGKIHLYLGLGSGIVVFLVSLSGALYVFQEEISLLLQSGVFRNVEVKDEPFISPLTIKQTVEDAFEQPIIYMNASVFSEGNRATIVWARDTTRNYTAFLLDPYSGEILDRYPYRITFWAIVLNLHTSLLIPEIGHHIVSVSVLIFVIMLISGLYLWFPKSKKGYKQRFKVKWNASAKRLTYDLHNVLGFYAMGLALTLAITGLVWSYEWVDNSVYWLATAGEQPAEKQKAESTWPEDATNAEIRADSALIHIINTQPNVIQYYLEYPRDSSECYSLTVHNAQGHLYNRNDKFYVDQYSGKTVANDLWSDKNNGEKLQEANYNIHVGAILAFPGKVLAFLASCICTSLPVTGFLIWRGRRRKRKK